MRYRCCDCDTHTNIDDDLAQPVACPECGGTLEIVDEDEENEDEDEEADDADDGRTAW